MKFIFLLTGFFVSLTLSSQEKLFHLNLEGKSYEKLIMFSRGSEMYIEGESDNGYNWTFRIPENLYETVVNFTISYQDYDYDKNEEYFLTFISIEDNDTLKTSYNNFTFDNMILNARFIKTNKTVFSFVRPLSVVSEYFLLDFQGNTDLRLRQKYPLFSFFQEQNDIGKTYEDFLEEYYILCQSNPDSRYLLSNIWQSKAAYLDRKDIKKLYDCFTSDLQNSFFGKQLYEYIHKSYEFENVKLLCSDNINRDYVIEHPDKYTLIVFSASWCIPCHRIVPKLKKLYEDLYDYMDIVYVSRDELETLPYWQSFLEKEEIPWRSFLSYDNKELYVKYDIDGIPVGLLVSPDGKAEMIKIAFENKMNEIYNLFSIHRKD